MQSLMCIVETASLSYSVKCIFSFESNELKFITFSCICGLDFYLINIEDDKRKHCEQGITLMTPILS